MLRTCRDANNENLDEEEIDEMVEALHEDGTTINQPFCFAPGAVAIKQMLVSKRLVRHDSIEYYTHDIEAEFNIQEREKKRNRERFRGVALGREFKLYDSAHGKKEWKTAMGEEPTCVGYEQAPRNAYLKE